jgi:ubiquinone/menaquinone biosynthesis C-methylase UbiE
MTRMPDMDVSHWVHWHEPYEDPTSPLSMRLRSVQSALRRALHGARPGPLRIVSLCAGQGRDVIDVLAEHERSGDVSALLVELDPELVAFARQRAADAGVAAQVSIVEGDASLCHWYADMVPADLVLVCGVFGNISSDDIARTIGALPGFCQPHGSVIWTRHRRQPDATVSIRADFAAAGFVEVSFEAPETYVLAVGHHRFVGAPPPPGSAAAFDPDRSLFEFIGDGHLPA